MWGIAFLGLGMGSLALEFIVLAFTSACFFDAAGSCGLSSLRGIHVCSV
jgi:hypothetical protein